MYSPKELKGLYENGKNIMQILAKDEQSKLEKVEMIEIAYDLQAGSYISALKSKEIYGYKIGYSAEIAKYILMLCEPISVLEAGVGEATTLCGVLSNLGEGTQAFGFDLSWSRVACANWWLAHNNIVNTTLCTGDLINMPYADNSIDVVYTSHSIEPNGGSEALILTELFRVARKFLILLEPAYEFADLASRERMDYHGYCKNLKGVAEDLGMNVIKNELFYFPLNPLNPTAITVISKDDRPHPGYTLACPEFKTPIELIQGSFFSEESLKVYPVIGGIPCLKIEDGILASKYREMMMGVSGLDGII